jgi:molecular chaperone DnaJ
VSESHYELLGVEPDASKEEIRSAYRDRLDQLRGKVEKGRSDQARDGARAETARLNAAWQVLSDPFQRQRYDAEITTGEATASEEGEEGEEEAAPAPARRRRFFEPREPREQTEGGERGPRGRERRQPVGVPGAEAAPLGRRLAALGIDVFTMGAVFVGVTSLLVSAASDSIAFIILLVTALFVIFNAYFVLPTVRTGQTLGKRLTHIMAVDADTGELPTWRRATLRYVVPIVLVIGLPGSLGLMAALLFGISWVLIDTRIGLMDRLGHTRVVLARYRPERPQ